MGDDEFRVPPANRREARRFEPPPWEADAFKELELRRATKETREDTGTGAVGATADEHTGQSVAGGVADEPASRSVGPAGSESGAAPAGGAASRAELDDEVVAALMARLRDEEPSAANYWVAWVVVGFLMMVLGSVMLIWAMAAYMKPDAGQVGTTGGSILLLFGAGFIGGGAWFIYRGLKKRGVL